MIKNDLNYISMKKEIQDDYNRRIQKRMKHTVWTSRSCNSWYLNKEAATMRCSPASLINILLVFDILNIMIILQLRKLLLTNPR